MMYQLKKDLPPIEVFEVTEEIPEGFPRGAFIKKYHIDGELYIKFYMDPDNPSPHMIRNAMGKTSVIVRTPDGKLHTVMRSLLEQLFEKTETPHDGHSAKGKEMNHSIINKICDYAGSCCNVVNFHDDYEFTAAGETIHTIKIKWKN